MVKCTAAIFFPTKDCVWIVLSYVRGCLACCSAVTFSVAVLRSSFIHLLAKEPGISKVCCEKKMVTGLENCFFGQENSNFPFLITFKIKLFVTLFDGSKDNKFAYLKYCNEAVVLL